MSSEYNDNMHKLIVDRLKERSRKLDIINECETSSKRRRYTPFIGLAIAACLTGFVFLTTHSLFDESSSLPEDVIRSGNVNVDELIKEKRYDDAIKVMEYEVSKSDSIIKVLGNEKDELDEESQYELQAEQQKRDDLKKKIENLKKKLK